MKDSKGLTRGSAQYRFLVDVLGQKKADELLNSQDAQNKAAVETRYKIARQAANDAQLIAAEFKRKLQRQADEAARDLEAEAAALNIKPRVHTALERQLGRDTLAKVYARAAADRRGMSRPPGTVDGAAWLPEHVGAALSKQLGDSAYNGLIEAVNRSLFWNI